MKTLSELRDEKGLTQKQLAVELTESTEYKWTPSTIAMYETGERTPPLKKAKAIANFFGVPVEHIIFGPVAHNKRATPKREAS